MKLICSLICSRLAEGPVFWCASGCPRGLLKTDSWSHPRSSHPGGLAGGPEFAFLTSSQARLLLLPRSWDHPLRIINQHSTSTFSGEELIPPDEEEWWAQRRQCGLMQITRTSERDRPGLPKFCSPHPMGPRCDTAFTFPICRRAHSYPTRIVVTGFPPPPQRKTLFRSRHHSMEDRDML